MRRNREKERSGAERSRAERSGEEGCESEFKTRGGGWIEDKMRIALSRDESEAESDKAKSSPAGMS